LSSCKKEPERDHSSTLEQYNVEEVIFTHPKSVDESKKILDYLKINNNYIDYPYLDNDRKDTSPLIICMSLYFLLAVHAVYVPFNSQISEKFN